MVQVKVTIKFNPGDPVPYLVGFRQNARVVCPENGILDKTKPGEPPVTLPVAPVNPPLNAPER